MANCHILAEKHPNMRKQYFAFLALALTFCTSAQIKFEKGYFLDIDNKKVECLIKNVDWSDNPSEFQYKETEEGKILTKKDTEVNEFSFGSTKFIAIELDVDQSSEKLQFLSTLRNPEFKKQRLFLKVVVDGTNKLYHYRKNEFQRFFYSNANLPIQQLIYKRYYPNANGGGNTNYNDMATNNSFRQQLITNVKCASTKQSDAESVLYQKSSLVKYFETVNQCNGDKVVQTELHAVKGSLNLKASAIIGQHGFSQSYPFSGLDFGSKTYATFGIEAEYVFPFLNNKWSAIAEPHYVSFKESIQKNGTDLTLNFKYVQIPVGARYYFFLENNSKIFVNGVLNYSVISKKSKVTFDDGSNDPFVFGSNSITFGLGAGYNYRKFSVEFRVNTKGNPSPYSAIDYDYNNTIFILRYQFLKL